MRRGKRGLASREPRSRDRWELSRNGLTRRLHIDLQRVSSAY
ncbi:putative leader peptide [Streptomyces sp. CEV 2-1]